MTLLISGRDLPEFSGTLLNHHDRLPREWARIATEKELVLLVPKMAATAALALKVWPEAASNISFLITTTEAAKNDPHAVESLLNSGTKVIICRADDALSVAQNPAACQLTPCGAHVETAAHSLSFGQLITDVQSDRKFARKNCLLAPGIVA